MNIQYLKSLQNYPVINGFKSKGIPESKIEQTEQQLGIKFPKAYKEFLYLAGELNNGLFGNAVEDDLEWAVEDFQEVMKEELIDVGVNLGKPFWAFTAFNMQSFDFFFLNEGENPPIYLFDPYNRGKEDKNLPKGVIKSYNSFSEYVDACIDGHKKGRI